MGRRCTVCTSPRRTDIDAALVAGEPFRDVGSRFGVDPRSLQRHKADHVPLSLTKAKEAREVADADDLLGQVRHLQRRALGILEKAEKVGDLRAANAAIGQTRGCIELMAKLLGELDDRPQVSVQLGLSPEWLTVRVALMEALAPFPEARQAVAQRLLALQSGPSAGGSLLRRPS